MLTIRLQRIGRRNEPHFRVVVAEHTTGPKSGKFVEQVGFRNPKTKEQKLDAERIEYWISVGAQPTDTVHNMLVKAGIIKGETRNVLPQKSPVVKEQPETASAEGSDVPTEEATEDATEEAGEPQADDVVEETAAPEAEEQKEETPAVSAEGSDVPTEEKEEETPAVSAEGSDVPMEDKEG